jgi:hypothetical protein
VANNPNRFVSTLWTGNLKIDKELEKEFEERKNPQNCFCFIYTYQTNASSPTAASQSFKHFHQNYFSLFSLNNWFKNKCVGGVIINETLTLLEKRSFKSLLPFLLLVSEQRFLNYLIFTQ